MRVSPLSLSLSALALVGPTLAVPHNGQAGSVRNQSASQGRAAEVKEAFQHAWTGYMKYAFPHDELHPVSNGYGDSR
jgi:mannosyl-oligosaccharide alpha-1,2-mannosidase